MDGSRPPHEGTEHDRVNERMPTLGRLAVAALLALSACTTHAPASASASVAAQVRSRAGDIAHGEIVFRENCAACHGASGIEGGVGPSLRGEGRRMSFARTAAWIENPDPPMPKLFPSPLSEKDVADVAAYVQSL